MSRQFNKYDLLIVLTLSSLAYGNSDVLKALLPIRIIGFIGLISFFVNYKLLYSFYRKWINLFLFWGVYLVISIMWSPDIGDAFIQTIHIFTMFGAFFILFLCGIKAINPIQSICCGWSLMVLITIPIAIWEMTTGSHLLSGSHNEGLMLAGQLRVFAAVTFDNLNSYSVILSFALPFVFSAWTNSWNTKVKVMMVSISIIMSGILLINASRGCILCLLLCVLFLLFSQIRHTSIIRILLAISVFIAVGYIAIEKYNLDLFIQISERLNNDYTGDLDRIDVITEGIKVAARNAFFGNGAASTVPMLTRYSSLALKVPHNCFVEMLIEHGIIITLSFFLMFYSSCKELWKTHIGFARFLAMYYAVASLPLLSIDDYYTAESGFWMYVASLVMVSSVFKYRNTENKCKQ